MIYLLATLVLISVSLLTGYGVRPSVWSTEAIVYCFFTGVVFFQWREFVHLNLIFLLASLALIFITFRQPELCFLMPIPLTYLVVYLGCVSQLSLPFMKGRDYSYGVYLYGFPITQAVLAEFPDIGRLALFFVSLTITLIFAAVSWHQIEKPFLRLKK